MRQQLQQQQQQQQHANKNNNHFPKQKQQQPTFVADNNSDDNDDRSVVVHPNLEALLFRRLQSCCRTVLIDDDDEAVLMNGLVGQLMRETKVDAQERRAIDGQSLSSRVVRVQRRSGSSSLTKTIRLVVLSDTHGFEQQLAAHNKNSNSIKASSQKARGSQGTIQTTGPTRLPDADVVIHCGDFWGSSHASVLLDSFLARQDHIKTKIVVRGNHDPKKYSFSKSKALYVTKPTVLTLEEIGLVLDLRPFGRGRNPQKLLPDVCDVLVSHEPPFGILDRTYRGDRVGSIPLRHAVESGTNSPALWLCGHIHEGRGAVWHTFSSEPTVVVNAANANSGKARRLVTGPVVVDIVPRMRK